MIADRIKRPPSRVAQVLARLLALLLILRVIAVPFIMAAPAPGLMAICSGGKIIYISMETGLPVDDDVSAAGMDCPIAAAAQVVLFSDPQVALPARRMITTGADLAAIGPPAAPARTDHQPRAPPLPV